MTITEQFKAKRCVFSIECFPPRQTTQMDKLKATLQQMQTLNPGFISVTFGAGGSAGGVSTAEVADYIQNELQVPTLAHLICIGNDQLRAAEILDQLEAVGVRDVLALRGDRPADYTGPDSELYAAFPHASDLIRHIRSHSPHLAIGAAAFPEAHAESPSFTADIAVMRDKFDCGAHFAITQLYFDNRSYFDYVERLRQLGVTAPIIPGILPVRSLASLRFTLKLCNARVPGKLINAVLEAEEKKGSEAVYDVGIAYARQQVQELLDGGVPGIHIYTLNRADMCIRLMDGLL